MGCVGQQKTPFCCPTCAPELDTLTSEKQGFTFGLFARDFRQTRENGQATPQKTSSPLYMRCEARTIINSVSMAVAVFMICTLCVLSSRPTAQLTHEEFSSFAAKAANFIACHLGITSSRRSARHLHLHLWLRVLKGRLPWPGNGKQYVHTFPSAPLAQAFAQSSEGALHDPGVLHLRQPVVQGSTDVGLRL